LYDNPEIDGKRLEAVAIKFLNAVKRHLKCKKHWTQSSQLNLIMIYSDISSGTCKGLPSSLPGATLFAKNDFEWMMLPCS
jgi:hypothetical protein